MNMNMEMEMEIELEEAEVPIIEQPLVCPQLERLPPDAMDLVLSFLHLYDLQAVSAICENLKLVVSRSSHLYMSPTAHLITEDDLDELLERFTRVNVLHLQGLGVVGDDIVQKINDAPAVRNIKELSLHGCMFSYWCPQSLRIPNLKALRLKGGSIRVSIAQLLNESSSSLKVLAIEQCSAIRDDTIGDLTPLLCNTLESLQLHQCNRLKRPVLRFAKLRSLSFVGGFGIQALPALNCPELLHLDLSFCVRMSSAALEDILRSLPRLRTLKLVKCSSLTYLKLSSRELTVLDMTYCSPLNDLQLDCPKLRGLHTAGCSRLETLVLRNALNLRKLDLLSLQHLKNLELDAANLHALNLKGCRRLDQVNIRSPCLEHVNVKNSRTVALRHCRDVRQAMMKRWSQQDTDLGDCDWNLM